MTTPFTNTVFARYVAISYRLLLCHQQLATLHCVTLAKTGWRVNLVIRLFGYLDKKLMINLWLKSLFGYLFIRLFGRGKSCWLIRSEKTSRTLRKSLRPLRLRKKKIATLHCVTLARMGKRTLFVNPNLFQILVSFGC